MFVRLIYTAYVYVSGTEETMIESLNTSAET
uniref:Uncharacterized protein n=1 Tax=Anguilla anguilla TaxID=7936 RepID=A0A0E9VT31_ANGAN